jgi:mannan endo-1,4-beta-mannosidase
MRLAGAGIAVTAVAAGCATYAPAAAPEPVAPATRPFAGHSHTAAIPTVPTPSPTAAPAAHHRVSHATRSNTPAAGPAVRGYRPLLGVYAKGMPRSYRPVEQFGAAVGKQPGIALFYSGFGERFPATFAAQSRAHGAVPLDQIEPTGISVAQIAAGRYDSYLKSYADEVRSYGHQVIIGFAHEMNGSWYSWGWTHVSPGTWVRAWRRVVTDFRSQRANNVTWLWTISRVLSQGPVRSYWPGAAYVNWVGIDGYYTEAQDTFSNVFVRVMGVVHQFTHDPILISESAIGQRAGQAQKIPNLLAGVLRYHLLGLVWFDVAQHGGLTRQDWRLEGHPAALAAFRRADRGFA